MTSLEATPTILAEERPAHQRHLRGVAAAPAVWLTIALLLVAVLAPALAPYGPTEVDSSRRLLPPSAAHWFGTDGFGMDIFSRVLYAARTDLVLALAAAGLAVAIGVPLGALSGYVGGWLDEVLQRMTEVIQSFPVVLLAMAVLTALGINLVNLVLVIALINIPVYLKIVRSVVLPMRSAEFVEAARCAGHGTASIVVRHIMPNTWGPVVAQFSINCAWAIQVIAGLSFLGLGVRVPEPEWGLMVQQGANYVVTGQWWVAFFPGVAIVIAVLALHLLGDWLRTQLGGGAP